MKSLREILDLERIKAKAEQLKALSQQQQSQGSNGSEKPARSSMTPNSLYDCHICNDEGSYIEFMKDQQGSIVYDIYLDDEGKEKARKAVEVMTICKCVAEKRVKHLFKSSRITDEMQTKGFKNFDTTGRPPVIQDAKHKVMEYAKHFSEIRKNRNNSIALLGQPGCGKTHLLMALANTLIYYGTAVIYFSWIDGFNDLKDNFDNLNDMIHRLQTVEVLFIDDMFKGRREITDFQRETLFAIINYRYLNHLPVLISSEKDTDQMCNMDEAIGSRIHEMCRDYLIVMQGKELNFRLRGEG